MALDDAYATCLRIARAHYENFPVASWLLPRAMRPHVAAVYAFARGADDFADEEGYPEEERCRLLDEWLARLHTAVQGAAGAHAPPLASRSRGELRRDLAGAPRAGAEGLGPATRVVGFPDAADHIFEALAHTIRRCNLPVASFEDLLSAFRQDVTVRRYGTWDDLLDYCRRSANPIGRLVLRIAGRDDERLDAASDAVCTALQLTNFWQDLAIDWKRGRLYVPASEREAAGAIESDLDAGRLTAAWRTALGRSAARTRRLFEQGREVGDALDGRLRYELRFTWLGGMRILERLEQQGFDVFTNRPSLGPADAARLVWRSVTWRRGGLPPLRTPR